MFSKAKIVWSAGLVMLCAYLWWGVFAASTQEAPVPLKSSNPAIVRQMQGVLMEAGISGEHVVSISADRVVMEKIQMGPVRFGLRSTARLENAGIKVFGGFNPGNPQPGRRPSFSGLFSRDPSKELTGFARAVPLFFKPLRMDFYSGEIPMAGISAGAAVLDMDRRVIAFSKHVVVRSEGRRLTAERAEFSPETGELFIPGPYKLRTAQGVCSGDCLKTDVLLQGDWSSS
ncbi:hypothetical protein SAMN02745216_04792 [Desulfatibacillum alkenivorans DSM 16219]|uniref:Uncharacterized protein n=1 Tax=Desulfatibacillum alkenivorans DSM 16219 TaxID=1121393 RepID=A0A1M6YP28_9BACT|nr:hypothetical protein SAMN02745216_04792 [Desulfatibacillum alkenivorans DSM 16219]